MKPKLLALALIAIFGVYSYYLRVERSESTEPSQTQVSMPMGSSDWMMGMMGKYRNGTYSGQVTDAFYGNVEVKITISRSQLTNVDFLQFPNERQTSRLISSQAIPILQKQAIIAQSAEVDGVSGASATSQAFVQSLGDALQKAKR